MASQPLVDKVMRETMVKTGVVDLPAFFNMIRHNELRKVERKIAEADMQIIGGPNCWDDHGHYPVHMAAAEGHVNMLRMLIESQANVDQPSEKENRTALHFAVINKSHEAVRYLIDVGARTDAKDIHHRTARMYAVDEDAMRVVFEVSALITLPRLQALRARPSLPGAGCGPAPSDDGALWLVRTVLHPLLALFPRARPSTKISRTAMRSSTA
jgi:hypothetical protein